MKNISDKRKLRNLQGIILLRIIIAANIFFLFLFLAMIFLKGYKVLSLSFLFEFPRQHMTEGGIFPAIIGTLLLTVISVIIAMPLGISGSIFLSEYARPQWLVKIIRLAINTLAGVPSIVYGLFGMAFFVYFLRFNVSILAGGCTLAVLILPIIINAGEEAIKTVPTDIREASYALGATKRETIIKIVLPSALPGILTGVILSIGRAAGETAPILFTAGTFYMIGLPGSLFDKCMALPYQIYALMTEGTHPEKQHPIAYGTAIVLLVLIFIINFTAVLLRYKIRRNRRW
ncbi:MAG: phosphate ABC transporter permease PstA [Spirochaetes bacterium]|nr:phosphate ABC transporter permease PstA [Spirochaetota bacterium]